MVQLTERRTPNVFISYARGDEWVKVDLQNWLSFFKPPHRDPTHVTFAEGSNPITQPVAEYEVEVETPDGRFRVTSAVWHQRDDGRWVLTLS